MAGIVEKTLREINLNTFNRFFGAARDGSREEMERRKMELIDKLGYRLDVEEFRIFERSAGGEERLIP